MCNLLKEKSLIKLLEPVSENTRISEERVPSSRLQGAVSRLRVPYEERYHPAESGDASEVFNVEGVHVSLIEQRGHAVVLPGRAPAASKQ